MKVFTLALLLTLSASEVFAEAASTPTEPPQTRPVPPEVTPESGDARPSFPPYPNTAQSRGAGQWTLSLGGGFAIPYPFEPQTFQSGPAALIDFSLPVYKDLHVWSQASISWLHIDGTLPIEPGFGDTLSVASLVIGLAYSTGLLGWLDLHLAAGLGFGTFGLGHDERRSGVAMDLSLGLRVLIDTFLAIRIDLVPTFIVPVDKGRTGSHLNLVARCEFRL